jgi:hypothetical protein
LDCGFASLPLKLLDDHQAPFLDGRYRPGRRAWIKIKPR